MTVFVVLAKCHPRDRVEGLASRVGSWVCLGKEPVWSQGLF
jgi:hypothetical protein